MTDSLTRVAADQQRHFDATTLPHTRKARGHFGTAPAVADFMAGMFSRVPQGPVRVLDAGAGVGTLSAALCQRLLPLRGPRRFEFELWENDPRLEPRLMVTMRACREAMTRAGHAMEFVVRTNDFVLEHTAPSLFTEGRGTPFDLVIMNPPYFKMRKDTAAAHVMAHVVHGQPNAYALFMAVAADLLRDGGELVAVTPRSYFNGPYFKRFRNWFFDRMTARHIHVFESRADAFRDDAVLQENVILLAEKGGRPGEVLLTSSPGRNFQHVDRHSLPYGRVIEGASGDRLVRVATSGIERQIIEAVDDLPHRFRDLPFKVSTGPVVTFRAREFLRGERSDDTAPLLWMHNVAPFGVRFPPKNGKPAHFLARGTARKLLLPAKRYLLLKRFTAKEERRRLVAGILEAGDSYAPLVALENHLNYIDRPNGELSADEAFGLAAWFNSAPVDRYFRAISGSTQVNAAEIRAMPMPGLEAIAEIGRAVGRGHAASVSTFERVVADALGLPDTLIRELCEAAPR